MTTVLIIYLAGIPFSWSAFTLRWPYNGPATNLANSTIWPITAGLYFIAEILVRLGAEHDI